MFDSGKRRIFEIELATFRLLLLGVHDWRRSVTHARRRVVHGPVTVNHAIVFGMEQESVSKVQVRV